MQNAQEGKIHGCQVRGNMTKGANVKWTDVLERFGPETGHILHQSLLLALFFRRLVLNVATGLKCNPVAQDAQVWR